MRVAQTDLPIGSIIHFVNERSPVDTCSSIWKMSSPQLSDDIADLTKKYERIELAAAPTLLDLPQEVLVKTWLRMLVMDLRTALHFCRVMCRTWPDSGLKFMTLVEKRGPPVAVAGTTARANGMLVLSKNNFFSMFSIAYLNFSLTAREAFFCDALRAHDNTTRRVRAVHTAMLVVLTYLPSRPHVCSMPSHILTLHTDC